MKKLFIVITLIIFIVTGIVSVFYATGNFEKIINKIFHRSEILYMSKEENFDEILIKIKESLNKAEGVRAEVKGSSFVKIGDYDPGIEEGEGKIDFVFPDKRLISTVDLPFSLRLRENFAGGAYEGKTIVLGNDIYIEFPWIAHALKEEKEKNKDFSVDKFPFASGWFHGVDGQSIPLPIPDTPGENLNFDLSVYPKGWDFTRDLEKIEEYLGIEEIDGIKCHHYKVKTKKRDLPPLEKGIILEQVGNKVRYVEDGREILFSLSDLLTLPIMYKYVEQIQYNENDHNSRYYSLTTLAIEGEIWVGESDFLVHKENYTREQFSISGYRPSEPERFMKDFYRNNIEITYSDFNGDIKIEAPTEAVTVEEYLKSIGYSSLEAYEEEQAKIQMKIRDQERRDDLRKIKRALSNFSTSQLEQSLAPPLYPMSNNELERTSGDSCVLRQLIPNHINELPIDSKDPEFYYTYKSDGFVYSLTARLENLENEDCVIENGICLYTLKGGNPAPDYEKIREIKDRCKGFLEIMDEKCVDGKLEMKVKVSTAGDCFVVSFIANYADNKKKIAEFSSLGDDVYLVVLNNCDRIEKLIVSGEGGFTIGN